MLQLNHIKKEYKTGDLVQKALDDVSLNLRDNEFVAILGPSGSGKTTLLNVIGGLDRYDSGDLIINGISTKKYTDRDWDSYRNHTIGFVFQSYNLIPHQTVLANVELALTISGVSGAERRRRAAEALRQVGLGDQLHKRPTEMSGGQMQRVAIARALCMEPELLVADEPIASLDVSIQAQIVNLFRHLQREHGFSFLFIAHDLAMVEFLCDRVGVLYHGKLVEVAPVRALYDHSLHPYTKALLAAMPIPDPRIERNRVLPDFSPGQFPLTGELIEVEPEHFVLQEGGAQ